MNSSMHLGITLTADGRNAEANIGKVVKNIEQVGNSSKKAAQSLGGIEKAAQGLGSAATTAGRALAAMGVAISVRELVKIADSYTNLASRIKLVSGTQKEFSSAMADVSAIANKYQVELSAVGQAYGKIAPVVASMGKSQGDMAALMTSLSAAMKVSGTEAGRMSEVMRQFSQAVSGPTVQMEEMNTIIDDASALWQGLGRQFPELIAQYGSLKEAISKGAVTSQDLINATIRLKSEFESQASTMRTTVSGAFQVLNNEFAKYIGQADTASGASGKFADTILLIAKNLQAILDPIASVTTFIVNAFAKWADAIEKVKSATAGLREVMGNMLGMLPDMGLQPRHQVIDKNAYSTGGGFGGEEATKPFFDGVKKGASESALALTKLTDKQKAVAQIVIDTAKAYKVDPAFALAIAQQESGFNQLAVSGKKAQGVMQLMPGTAKQLGVNFSDLNDNIKGGVLYLSQQEKQFKSLRLAAAAYNAGPGNVQKYGGVPPFKETQNYVTSVGALYQKWQQVLGAQGEAFVSAKDQADELSSAFKQVQTHQDDNIKKADEYARVQVEKIKTQLAAMDQEREAAARLTAEQLAGAKTYEDKARIIEAAQAKAAEYNAQALEMVRAEYDAQQQALEAKKQAYQAELAQADKYNVSIDDQFKLKQAIRAADNDLLLLAENRAQAEITAAGKVNEFAKQSADLKRNEVTAIDGIIAAYQRQADILDRLTAAKQAGANADQLALLNDYYQSTGNLPELVSPDQIERMQQYILSTQALKGAVDELTGSQKKNQEQAVREEQLRMNAYWDQTIGRLREYAALMKEITGQDNNPWSDMAIGAMEYAKNVDQITSKYVDLQSQWRKSTGSANDQKDQYLAVSEALEQGQAAAAMLAKTMLVARQNTEKGSQAYNNLTTAAENFMVVLQLLNVADGIAAVLKQLKEGDPYTAAIRAAGVAMMVASMGINTGFGGGGGSGKTNTLNRTGAGGGVFGDSEAQSESVTKSLDLIAENSSVNLAYSAGMYRALKNIEAAMGGVTNSIIRGVSPAAMKLSGTSPFGMDIQSSMMRVIDPIGSTLGLTKIAQKISDFGIAALPQALDKILAEGFKGYNWTQVTQTFKFIGMTMSSSVKDIYTELDAGVANQVTLTIRSMADTVKEAGKAFGISGDQFNSVMSGFVVNFGKFSTAGMKGDELKEAVQQMFSTMSDDMAAYFSGQFELGLEPFQKAGEGMFETLVRVADGINVAGGLLAQAGLEAIKYQDIALKQGDVAAEIVRQSITAFEGAFSTIGKYINGAVGSAEELLATYEDLLSIRAMSGVVGLSFRKLTNDMVLAAGGVDKLRESLAYYIENFIGIGGTAGYQMAELADSFRKLGIEVPASKEAFRDLVEGIDQTTPAGQKLYAQILKLGPAFITAAESAKQLEDLYNRLKGGKPFGEADAGWEQLWDDWSSVIEGKLAEIQAPFDAEIDRKVNSQREAIRGWSQAITSASIGIGTINAEIARLGTIGTPAQGAIKSLGQLVTQLYKNIGDWQKKIKAANAEIDRLEGETNPEYEKRRQELLREQGNSLIRNIMEMWSKMIDGISNLANSLQDQMDSLAVDSIGATLGTANQRLTQAYGAYQSYKDTGGNDVNAELGYLGAIQSAVMARYNAELAVIQDAQAKYIEAETERLNAALQLQIDAINTATDAAIEAENDRLEAAIKAQSKIDEAAIKSQQKQFDAANKLTQKQFDAEIKAEQKAFDAANKLVQKQFDLEQKALQKAHDAQLKALGDELDAANKLRDAIKSVADYAQSLKLGQNSTLSPEARLAEAQRQYQTLVSAAQGGDVEAMSKLAGASDAYLEAAKTYYGSSTNYQDIFDGVQRAMESIGGMSAPDPDSIQSRIDLLREAQAEEMDKLRELQAEKLDAIRESQAERLDALRESQADRLDAISEIQAEQLDAIREAQQDNLDAMREASQKTADAIRDAAQRQIDEAQKQTQQAIKDLSDPNANAAIRELKDRTVEELKALQLQAEKLRDQANLKALDWEREVRDWMTQQGVNDQSMLNALNAIHAVITGTAVAPTIQPATPPSGNGTTPPPPGFNSWDDYWYWAEHQNPIPGYAKGGYAQAGLALVGERGPEIVRFERPAQVMTADETRDALRGGNDGKIVQAIAELKAEMRAVVVTQSNANPQIINKLTGMEDRLNQIERTNKLVATSK